MLVGIISDTHGLLRPEAVDALSHAAMIIHAGDVGEPAVLDRLRELAPVVAVRGNIVAGRGRRACPKRRWLPPPNTTSTSCTISPGLPSIRVKPISPSW